MRKVCDVAQWDPNLRRVEYHREETRWHIRVQPDLHMSLNLIFRLDQCIERLICMDYDLTIRGHHANEGGIPLFRGLGEGSGAGAHENLTDTVVELLDT